MNYHQPPPQRSNTGAKIAIVLASIFIGTPILLCCAGGVYVWALVAFQSEESKAAGARRAWEEVIEEERKIAVKRADRERQAQAQRGSVGPGDQVGALQAVYDDLQDNQKLKNLKARTERMYGPIPPDLADELNGPAADDDH